MTPNHTTDTDTGPKAAANKMKFTDLALARMKPPETGQSVIWDDAQKGLSVLLSSGGTRTFRATFNLDGCYVTAKIGRVGELPLGEARKRVAAMRVQAADGIDPRRPKVEPKAAKPTYAEVVEKFVTQWCQPRQRTWKVTRAVLLNGFPDWHSRPFDEITKSDARAIIRGFLDAGLPYKATAAIAWTRKLWRWAAGEDIIPVAVMENLGVVIDKAPRERHFDDAEVKAIWNAADKLEPHKSAYFKLLVLLGPRKTALANMKWSDIKDNVWITPFEDTKSRKSLKVKRTYATPLAPLTLRILAGLPKTSERVFPHFPKEISQWFAWELIKNGAPVDFFFHACRHTVATWLAKNGANMYEIGLVLNHSGGSGVTAGYVHGSSTKLKLELLSRWEQHIVSLVQPAGAVLLR